MSNSKELRIKAWESLKGKYWTAFWVALVLGTLYALGANVVSFAQKLAEIVGMVDPAEMDRDMKIGALVLSGAALLFSVIGFLITIFVGYAAQVGLCNYFIRNTESKPSFANAFSGFKGKYRRNLGTLLLADIKVVLWSLLFVVPGIIKMFEYAMVPYILADDAEISCKEAFAKSKEMMRGNKWRLFKLNFSFFGWLLLSCLTLGVGTLFLSPYMEAANAEFYAELKK